MSTPARLIKAVVKRLERLETIRSVMQDGFVFTGDRQDRLRRDVVTARVAEEIKCEVSPRLRATVVLLGKQLGWRTLATGNVRLFAGVRQR
jgi:hypothetical protein